MPEFGKQLEIIIKLNKQDSFGGIRLWNYNKSTIESVKGFKEIEIFYKQKSLFSGLMNRGCGNQYTDYSTVICLDPSVRLPEVVVP